jgi:CPA1 family monovalent cation:H+ antiporter
LSVTISLLTGYLAFIPADIIGASGILATVTAGIYMGVRGPHVLPARARLQGYFVWDIVDFIINAILFVLIGLQLRAVVDGLSGYPASTLAGYALAVTGVVVGVSSDGSSPSRTSSEPSTGARLSARGAWERAGVW